MESNSHDGGTGGNENTIHINIPWANLPKVPFYGALGGFTTDWQQRTVASRVAAAYLSSGRPLTDVETEALSYWWARGAAHQGYQVPVYFASTFYFLAKARPTWRFPFYQPKEFNPYAFPSRSNAWLQGKMAHNVWRFVQVSAYYTASRVFTGLFFTSWAMSSASANISKDERLQQWIHDTMESQKRRFETQRTTGVAGPPGQPQKISVEVSGRRGGSEEAPQEWHAQEQDQGQTSPTAQQQPTWGRTQPAPSRPQAQPQYQPSPPVADDPFDDDDASPVAPASRRQQQPPAAAPGGAWARVRQGQVPRQEGQAGSWSKARQNADPNADQQSYSYNKGEEEKSYAQQRQAQKEFDEMLERERQGKEEKSNRRW